MFSMADVQREDRARAGRENKGAVCPHIASRSPFKHCKRPPSHKSGKNAACSTRLQMFVCVCDLGTFLSPSLGRVPAGC